MGFYMIIDNILLISIIVSTIILFCLFISLCIKEGYIMASKASSLHEIAELVYELTCREKHRKNLIDAYTSVRNKTKTNFTYEEVKDYIFHHDLRTT